MRVIEAWKYQPFLRINQPRLGVCQRTDFLAGAYRCDPVSPDRDGLRLGLPYVHRVKGSVHNNEIWRKPSGASRHSQKA